MTTTGTQGTAGWSGKNSVAMNTKWARQPARALQPVVDPAGWTNADFTDSSEWLYILSDAEVADLDRTVAAVERSGVSLADVSKADFPLPILGSALASIREEVLDGRGFVLIRGVPVYRYTRLQSAIAFWGIGSYLGEPVSQNARGHLLGHVIDVEAEIKDPAARGYYTAKILPFHVDGIVDVVGLMCLQPAKSGGQSALASSIAIHNEMLRRQPELVAALAQPIYRDRHDEIPEGALPYFPMPVFNYVRGYLTTNYGNIRTAHRFAELPPHSSELAAGLKMFQDLASELCITMDFQQGDVQFLNNHVIVHSRISAVEDYPEVWRKRHLLRLRMMTPDGGRPVPNAFFGLQNLKPEEIGPDQRPSGGILAPGLVLKVPLDPE